MFARLASWVLGLVGLLLLALAVRAYFVAPAGPSLTTPVRDIEVSESVAGQTSDVAIRLHNDSGRPLRIVGIEEC